MKYIERKVFDTGYFLNNKVLNQRYLREKRKNRICLRFFQTIDINFAKSTRKTIDLRTIDGRLIGSWKLEV